MAEVGVDFNRVVKAMQIAVAAEKGRARRVAEATGQPEERIDSSYLRLSLFPDGGGWVAWEIPGDLQRVLVDFDTLEGLLVWANRMVARDLAFSLALEPKGGQDEEGRNNGQG